METNVRALAHLRVQQMGVDAQMPTSSKAMVGMDAQVPQLAIDGI